MIYFKNRAGTKEREMSALLEVNTQETRTLHARLIAQFPENPYVKRLVQHAEAMGITFGLSPVEEQWLYNPQHRTIYVWEPDLYSESLSYIVVILAHELGHAVDFEINPLHIHLTRDLFWHQVPDEIEIAAFVQGFRLLKQLWIPVSLAEYEMMIAPELASTVRERVERHHLCCLLSPESVGAATVPCDAHAAC